jgi:hypothetical protein
MLALHSSTAQMCTALQRSFMAARRLCRVQGTHPHVLYRALEDSFGDDPRVARVAAVLLKKPGNISDMPSATSDAGSTGLGLSLGRMYAHVSEERERLGLLVCALRSLATEVRLAEPNSLACGCAYI